jgi:hypothetical protein
MQAIRRVAVPRLSIHRQAVRNGGHARPRSQAFLPQFVNYYNPEDQVRLSIISSSLSLSLSLCLCLSLSLSSPIQ